GFQGLRRNRIFLLGLQKLGKGDWRQSNCLDMIVFNLANMHYWSQRRKTILNGLKMLASKTASSKG
ncbi:hypothetical protein HN873_069598, partial [Arachis hypogaea]